MSTVDDLHRWNRALHGGKLLSAKSYSAMTTPAGKAAGVPVYKLLGGKVRDKVRVYNGSVRKARAGDRPDGAWHRAR